MSTFLTWSELPRDRDGAITGTYAVRERSGGLVEGVGERAVEGPELERLDAGLGAYITIAPADAATAEACARRVFELTGDGPRAKALRALFATRKKKAAKAAQGDA